MNDESTGSANASRERRLSAAVFQWATGIASPQAGRVVLCRTGEGLDAIAPRGDAGDRYLIPSELRADTRESGNDRVLTFEGRFAESGDVMHIGNGYEIELRDYSAIPFMPIARPTVVSFPSSVAWRAFIEDAEDARATGAFIAQLTSRSVVLSDRTILDAAIDHTRVRVNRLTVESSQAVRYLPGAAVVGTAATIDLDDQSAAALLCGDGETIAAGTAMAGELAERPWLRRYLAALRIVGGEDGTSWSISGFGDHLTTPEERRDSRSTGHLIVWRGDEYRLVAASGRRFVLARPTAIAIESLLVSSSLDDADAVARASGLGHPRMTHELVDLRGRLAAVGVAIDHSDGEEV